MSRLKILLVDDDPAFRERFALFGAKRFDVATVATGGEGVERVRAEPPDAVLLDIDLGGGPDGFEVLRSLRAIEPDLPILMFTGDERPETAARAISAGANDFVSKSPDLGVLEMRIERARQIAGWMVHARALQTKGAVELLGDSSPMRRLREEIARAGPTSVKILIQGETGSGKELVARALHAASTRRSEKFVDLSAAATTDELFDDELFGHERGAYTGAEQRRIGQLELAHRGTLFVDEIGKANATRQSKLLRVLQDGRFRRLGGQDHVEVDVRWITAANEPLREWTMEGRFLKDLYHRLAEYPIVVPPLRERLEDLPVLARALADAYTKKDRFPPAAWEPDDLDPLYHHPWPGNVRELGQVMMRAIVGTSGGRLRASDLARALTAGASPSGLARAVGFDEACDEFERTLIERALARSGGNVTRAAERLGLQRQRLHAKMKRLGIRGSEE